MPRGNIALIRESINKNIIIEFEGVKRTEPYNSNKCSLKRGSFERWRDGVAA